MGNCCKYQEQPIPELVVYRDSNINSTNLLHRTKEETESPIFINNIQKQNESNENKENIEKNSEFLIENLEEKDEKIVKQIERKNSEQLIQNLEEKEKNKKDNSNCREKNQPKILPNLDSRQLIKLKMKVNSVPSLNHIEGSTIIGKRKKSSLWIKLENTID